MLLDHVFIKVAIYRGNCMNHETPNHPQWGQPLRKEAGSILGNFPVCRLGIDDLVANRQRNRMRTVDRSELARGSCKMLLCGALRDVQDLADLPGRLTLRGPGDHL